MVGSENLCGVFWTNLIGLMACVALALAGCDRQTNELVAAAKIAGNGDAKRDVQTWFDDHRQCAFVLSTDRTTGELMAEPSDDAAKALMAAGIIEPSPTTPVDYPSYRFFRPTVAGKKFFEQVKRGIRRELLLCYARRDVSKVLIDDNGRLHYTFRLTAAHWVNTPAIRKAFPGIAATRNCEFVGEEHLSVREGHPVFGNMQQTSEHPTLFAIGAVFQTAARD